MKRREKKSYKKNDVIKQKLSFRDRQGESGRENEWLRPKQEKCLREKKGNVIKKREREKKTEMKYKVKPNTINKSLSLL